MQIEGKKDMEKRMYEFTNNGNSCVIYDSKPPRYWFNYLWNENGYCAQISQMGHGRSYYINEKADMCMINNNDARYIYLRDEKTKECWNIGDGPLNTKVEDYSCEATEITDYILDKGYYITLIFFIFTLL